MSNIKKIKIIVDGQKKEIKIDLDKIYTGLQMGKCDPDIIRKLFIYLLKK